MASECLVCARGFHEECLHGCVEHNKESATPVAETLSEKFEEFIDDVLDDDGDATETRKRGTTAEGLKDPKSTGRKRAARLYPLDRQSDCEWKGYKNCGGGLRPIIGCIDGKQQHRHHGPVKNTTRNHEGNVHRICTACHNHWHELNDLVYDELNYGLLPHDPVAATPEEIAKNISDWLTGEIGKRYELASTHNLDKFKSEE